MQSVTNTDVQLAKPAIRRLCSNKNCQSTRCSSLKKQSQGDQCMTKTVSLNLQELYYKFPKRTAMKILDMQTVP